MSDLSNRQAASSRQGTKFEQVAETLLLCEGWTIDERHWIQPEVEVEIDYVATDRSGEQWWIECKGSWESTRNGLERTDTLKKAIGSAAILRLLEHRRRYMVIASHMPKVNSSGDKWMQLALTHYFDAVCIVSLDRREPRPDSQLGDTDHSASSGISGARRSIT